MDSVALDTPAGITARLGWAPDIDEGTRVRALARELVSARANVEPERVRFSEDPHPPFGHHELLHAEVGGAAQRFLIKTASFRGASVAALSDEHAAIGLDIRDLVPTPAELKEMRRHSRLWLDTSDAGLLAHWTRVQAVLHADARGIRVRPEDVRLNTPLNKGWVPDRPAFYGIKDLSRDGFVVTLAYMLPAK